MANDLIRDQTVSGTFADQLRAYRARAGLSQSELALRANLSARGVSDLERGVRRAPYLPTVHALSVALNLTAAEAESFAASVTRGRMRSRTAVVARPEAGSLPSMYTSFIGRQSELTKLKELLLDSAFRLVTITGPPGVGKTRLAIQAAHDVEREHGMLAVYVRLAGLHSADQLPPAIAAAFGLSPDNPAGLLDAIFTRIGSQSCLAVLDNFEHVLPAFGDLVSMLRRCPGLRILVTSRAPLQVRGEMEFPLAPLVTPPADDLQDWQSLATLPSVALLVDRIKEHSPDFAVTPQNGAILAAISRRLEGIPLAIEIAAARSVLLTPGEVLSGLSDRLEFLTDGPPDLPPRQRSLEHAIAWSYRLLTNAQKRTLRLLSVLDGAWMMEEGLDLLAAYARSRSVRPGPVADVQSLVRHGLLLTMRTKADDQVRFQMLEMISDFAAAQLRAAGELDAAHAALLAAVSGLAERVAPRLRGPGTDEARAWLDDHDVILRSALHRCLEHDRPGVGTNLLWTLRFWFDGEPQAWLPVWLESALQHPMIVSDALAEARLRVLLGFHLLRFGDARGADVARSGLSRLTEPEFDATRAEAIDLLQPVIREPDLSDLVAEADRFAEMPDVQAPVITARALAGRGRRRLGARRLAEAAADFDRALDLSRGDDSRRRYLYLYLAAVQVLQGELSGARETLVGCLSGAGPSLALRPIPYLYATLGRVHQRLDRRYEAAAAYGEALRRALAVGASFPLPIVLDGVAWLASQEGRNPLAAWFLGAAEMQSISTGSHGLFDSLRDREELILHLRGHLGFHRFFTLYEEGRRTPLESVLADAAAEIQRHVQPGGQTPRTRRSSSR